MPHFKCDQNNAVFVTMDKILKKSQYPNSHFEHSMSIESTGSDLAAEGMTISFKIVIVIISF